jgi:O-antigen/teichoic acid export membrane protein
MQNNIKHIARHFLRFGEQYVKTDMLYLFKAGFWSNINSAIITFFSLLLYIAYAHFLSKEAYGTYQFLLSFFSIATGFTLTGMNSALVRAVAQGNEGTVRASIPLQIKFGIIPFLGAIGFASYYYLQGNMLLALGLVAIGALTPFLYAFNSYSSYFIGKRDFRGSSLYSGAGNFIYYAALIAVAFVSGSPLVLLAANLGVQTLINIVLYLTMLRRRRPNEQVDQESLKYGMHLSFMSALASVAGQLGGIFVFHFLGPVSLALYSFANAGPERLGNLFFKFLGSALLPKYAERSAEEIRATLIPKMWWAFGVGGLVGIGYAILAYPFFMIFFPTYIDAVPYSLLCALGLAIGTPLYLPTAALTALQNTRGLYIYNAVTPITQIAFPLAGIFLWGLWGYIVGLLLTTAFAVVLSTILVYHTGK